MPSGFILDSSEKLNAESFRFLQISEKTSSGCECSAGVAYGVVISLFDGLIFHSWHSAGSASSTIKPALSLYRVVMCL